MQKRKGKKIHKMRGRRAAGYGFSAGHRASGQRGGKGKAGTKKHHYIKTMIEEGPDYFGKHGFKRPQKLLEEIAVINVGELDSGADRLVSAGLATKKGARYIIDIAQLGADKVLGSGRVKKKLDLKGVRSISERAREKITSVGGTVDLPVEE
jgi:large subunit ribosomal protein L15